MNTLSFSNLSKHYGSQILFSHISYTFAAKGFYTIVGDSGCGKSTLLELLAGLDKDYEGSIVASNYEYKRQSEEWLASFRLTRIGFIRQGYDLLELEKALDNVLLPLEAVSNDEFPLLKKKGEDLVEGVGLSSRLNHPSKVLSGGEKQRLCLARSLSNQPLFLLADEPTGALDHKNAEKVLELLSGLSKKILVIMVSHDRTNAYRYSDVILSLGQGALKEEILPPHEKKFFHLASITSWGVKKQERVPFLYTLKHAWHLLLAKRHRSFLACSILSFSLLSLGLSLYMGQDVQSEIGASFASLLGDSHLVVNKEDAAMGSLSRLVSVKEDEAIKVVHDHPFLASDYGLYYQADLPSYFPDANEAFLSEGSHKITIDNLGGESINDFAWLEDLNAIVYPSMPAYLEDDQVVLGLNFTAMANVCFQLHILRTYERLGSYLEYHPLELVFRLENDSWNYSDEEIVQVVGIVKSSKPTLYHYNHLWNQYLYEEKMRFPTSDEPDDSLPWIMQKIFYLKPLKNSEDFMEEVRSDSSLEPYFFLSDKDRYYLYWADKHSFTPSLIKEVVASSGYDSYIVGGEQSYVSYSGGLMHGFMAPFYASTSVEELDSIASLVSYLPIEEKDVDVLLPPSSIMGSYLKPASLALNLSNDFSKLTKGRKPQALNEVCLSSYLATKWQHPQEISVLGLIKSAVEGDYLNQDYKMGQLKVVGEVTSSNPLFFVNSYWSIDYFREELGMSSALLEPTSLLFQGASLSPEKKAQLVKTYPSCRFYDPSEDISKSLESTFSYVKLVLSLASGVSLLLSFLLITVISVLEVQEGEKEERSLFILGFSRGDIFRFLFSFSSLPLTLSLGVSLVLLSIFEVIIHEKIQEAFGGLATPFIFDFLPFFAIILTILLSFLLLSLGIWQYVERQKLALMLRNK